MAELISILIPCFNAEQWLACAIQSALDQSWPHKEIIVVDDGSTDGSREVMRGFGEKIRVDYQARGGGNRARNRLVELSRGRWLQFLDADDYLEPDKISSQVNDLAEDPGIDVLFGPIVQEFHFGSEVVLSELPIPEPRDPWVLLARWRLPQTGSPLWRKAAIEEVSGWKNEQPCCQEHELYLRLLMAGKQFLYTPSTGAVYRRWSNQTVCTKNIAEVHRRKMAIIDTLEQHLRSRTMMTDERQYAINMGRFETARAAWQYDHAYAGELVRRIHGTDSSFVPTGPSASKLYQLTFRACGFANAERVATWRRNLLGRRSSSSCHTNTP